MAAPPKAPTDPRIRLSDKTSRLHPRHVMPRVVAAFRAIVPQPWRLWRGSLDRYGNHGCDWAARGIQMPVGDSLQHRVAERRRCSCSQEPLGWREGGITHPPQQKIQRHFITLRGNVPLLYL